MANRRLTDLKFGRYRSLGDISVLPGEEYLFELGAFFSLFWGKGSFFHVFILELMVMQVKNHGCRHFHYRRLSFVP
ncbi:hypothetical protein D3C80_2081950 [compost metagenome]